MIDRERVASVMRTKRAARRRGIESLRARALVRGATDDPGYWTLVHDLECAPITTNLAQLEEIGLVVPDERWLDDDEVSGSLATIIEGLALLEVFLRHTDHLDDRMLHRELRCRVLVEPVRDVPDVVPSVYLTFPNMIAAKVARGHRRLVKAGPGRPGLGLTSILHTS